MEAWYLPLHDRASQSNPELTDTASLASQFVLGIAPLSCLSRLELEAGYETSLAFMWVLGIQTLDVLCSKHLATDPTASLCFNNLFLFNVHWWSDCMHVCEGVGSLGTGVMYGKLCPWPLTACAMWVLGVEPGSSGRVAGALNL